ncbi:MAG: hypothetical protein U5J95_07170 [Balneolaceae bacterium]|nr:hypothetical protein [Balneolaceae bacterium]
MIESIEHNDIEEKIDRYVNGQLSEKEIEELWIELIQDEYHLDYLKSVANLKEAVKNKKKQKEKAQVRRYWSYSAAAVIIVLVTVLSVFNIPGLDSSASVEPIASIELDYYRSADGTLSDNGEDKQVISDAIALANTGKFDQAVSLLNTELEKASDIEWKAELNLNLGSLYYNEGSYQKSTEYFQNVIAAKESVNVLVLEKAYWYLGNAYFQLDRLSQAQQNIQSAYDLNGAYRRVAKSYLDALATAK